MGMLGMGMGVGMMGRSMMDMGITYSSPEKDEEEPDGVEEMVGRHPEHELQVEGVQLRDQEAGDEADDSEPPVGKVWPGAREV